jgi:hypothetical protein
VRTGIGSLYDPAGPDPDVLFIGNSANAVGWYRCYLPAMFMGADWIGVRGHPPDLRLVTGMVRGRAMVMPDLTAYRVIVVQQPASADWRRTIRKLRDRGITVLFEIDDYVHGIPKLKRHDWREHFTKEYLRELERTMRVCDGLIVSTEYLARRYRRFNENVWVCENGLDTARYELTRPPRETVNIGWAGGTGHEHDVAKEWFIATGRVMADHEATCFVSVGLSFGRGFEEAFGQQRALSIPFAPLEVYPGAMTMFDIALAPAGKGLFFKGKSDLRWLEAGALGIPIIADPDVYPHVEHGVTGFHAHNAYEVEDLLRALVEDPKLRLEVGANAKEYVHTRRDMTVAVRAWVEALNAAAA